MKTGSTSQIRIKAKIKGKTCGSSVRADGHFTRILLEKHTEQRQIVFSVPKT